MNTADVTVAILGAGFSGIGAAIRLRQEGLNDFVILEQGDDVGGTWRDNVYPGVACDVPATLYSFSFELNPDWSRTYAPGGEIQEYLQRCTDKHDLRRSIRFGQTVVGLSFDAAAMHWVVRLADGSTLSAQYVISGLGPLNRPALPQIDGIDSFRGPILHSARWPRAFSAAGKRVAVIGTGASSVQIVPHLAKEAAHLTVLQRSAPWILPKPDQAVSEAAKARLRRWPFLQRLQRWWIFFLMELYGPFVYHRADFFKNKAEAFARRYRERKIPDPELRRKCAPNYRIGCKRILFTSDWYDSLSRENVSLETQPIERIVPEGILLRGGKLIEVDTIVCATGFDAPTAGALFPIIGLGGRDLGELWRDGAYAYKGMAMSGFPNLFFALGPNTGPGHTSVLVYVETQINYIIQAITHCRARGIAALDLREERLRAYNAWIDRRMEKMVWTNGACHSWYLTKAGRNTSLYPGPAAEYCLRARWFRSGDYCSLTRRPANPELT